MYKRYPAADSQALSLSRLFRAFDSDLLLTAAEGEAHVFSPRYQSLLAALFAPQPSAGPQPTAPGD